MFCYVFITLTKLIQITVGVIMSSNKKLEFLLKS